MTKPMRSRTVKEVVGLKCFNHQYGCNCEKSTIHFFIDNDRTEAYPSEEYCATMVVHVKPGIIPTWKDIVKQQSYTEPENFVEMFKGFDRICDLEEMASEEELNKLQVAAGA